MAVAAFALFVSLAGLTQLPPMDRDEARFAQATAQMLESGDFISIRFLQDERNKKPVGIHWLQAASVAIASDPSKREIWAYRLPSVLSAMIACVLTAWIGERMFGAGPGLVAGLLLASTPIMAAEATLAKTDAALLAMVTAAMAAFLDIVARTADGKSIPRSRALMFWSALGFGVLLKGPVILLVTLPAVALCAWRYPFIDVVSSLRPLMGIAILTIMVVPWVAAVSVATEGRFIAEAVGRDMFDKVTSAQELHNGPPGYHLLLLCLLIWPAAPIIGDGAVRTFRGRKKWRWFFLIAWAVPAWLVFELTATKLPHYTLPVYPAIIIAAAAAALEKRNGDNLSVSVSRSRRIGAIVYFGIGLAFAGIFAGAPFLNKIDTLLSGADVSSARSSLKATTGIGLGLLFVAASGGVALDYCAGKTWRPMVASSLVSAAFAWIILTVVMPTSSPITLSERIAAQVKRAGLHEIENGAPGAVLVGYSEPSAVLLLGSGSFTGLPDTAAKAAIDRAGGAAIVDKRFIEEFEAKCAARGIQLSQKATVRGLNYSNGRRLELTVYGLN
ncbi:MAG: glycosyltransferase family 39 protein [Pseudomonadota bacterium]